MTDTFSLPDIPSANAKHDQEHGSPYEFQLGKVGSAWKSDAMSRRGLLTDRKIAKYAQMGYYTEEFREARKKHNEKKRIRIGSFVKEGDRLIYSPL